MPGSYEFKDKNGKQVVVIINNNSIYINGVKTSREQLAELTDYTLGDIEMSESQFNSLVCYLSLQLGAIPVPVPVY